MGVWHVGSRTSKYKVILILSTEKPRSQTVSRRKINVSAIVATIIAGCGVLCEVTLIC